MLTHNNQTVCPLAVAVTMFAAAAAAAVAVKLIQLIKFDTMQTKPTVRKVHRCEVPAAHNRTAQTKLIVIAQFTMREENGMNSISDKNHEKLFCFRPLF